MMMDRALTVHLGTYYTKYQIIFLKFIVGLDWGKSDAPMEQDRPRRGVFFKVSEIKNIVLFVGLENVFATTEECSLVSATGGGGRPTRLPPTQNSGRAAPRGAATASAHAPAVDDLHRPRRPWRWRWAQRRARRRRWMRCQRARPRRAQRGAPLSSTRVRLLRRPLPSACLDGRSAGDQKKKVFGL